MSEVLPRISAGYADTSDLGLAGTDWALVAGVPCEHLDLPYPWATCGRLLASPEPPSPAAVAEVAEWLGARSPQWSLTVRAEDEVEGYVPWELLPALVRGGTVERIKRTADIGPARSVEEFLSVYSAQLAPLVTAEHLASPRMAHLVARVDGQPVGCARVRRMGDTAYIGAITVLEQWRGRGLGADLTVAAGEVAATYSDLIWLHCTPASRGLYERLGYRHAGDHAQLVRAPG